MLSPCCPSCAVVPGAPLCIITGAMFVGPSTSSVGGLGVTFTTLNSDVFFSLWALISNELADRGESNLRVAFERDKEGAATLLAGEASAERSSLLPIQQLPAEARTVLERWS